MSFFVFMSWSAMFDPDAFWSSLPAGHVFERVSNQNRHKKFRSCFASLRFCFCCIVCRLDFLIPLVFCVPITRSLTSALVLGDYLSLNSANLWFLLSTDYLDFEWCFLVWLFYEDFALFDCIALLHSNPNQTCRHWNQNKGSILFLCFVFYDSGFVWFFHKNICHCGFFSANENFFQTLG